MIAPAAVAKPIIARLNAAMNKAITTPAFREHIAQIGDEPVGGTPEDFAKMISADYKKWGDVINRAGIKFE